MTRTSESVCINREHLEPRLAAFIVSSRATDISASSMSSLAPHSASSSSSLRSGEANAKYLHGMPLRSGESL
jgi:hypothetical protein